MQDVLQLIVTADSLLRSKTILWAFRSTTEKVPVSTVGEDPKYLRINRFISHVLPTSQRIKQNTTSDWGNRDNLLLFRKRSIQNVNQGS